MFFADKFFLVRTISLLYINFRHPSFAGLHFFGVGSMVVAVLRRSNPYGMHSQAGAWQQIKLLAIFLSE